MLLMVDLVGELLGGPIGLLRTAVLGYQVENCLLIKLHRDPSRVCRIRISTLGPSLQPGGRPRLQANGAGC